ncbi:MAG: acetyl-CoA carboxylase biotin carboxyl carrier protein subunit [Calditrichaeota bacterium]|nr:acetyl-CoA carboxylase biotin carboxyl carrier protein subunit [Calditrichota bacterium]RQV92519.1 MAG: acetyl-CoA carboxylase biotin carboxyl carrier protein subunit [bacterium]
MKEYTITINDKPHNVIIKKIQTDTAIIEVNGKEIEVGIERHFKKPTEPLHVRPTKTRPSPVPEEPGIQKSSTPFASGDIVAPLPGLILNVMVKEGDKVSSDQTVMKMEAMKMENEIKADRSGTVRKIFVKEGDAVLENTPLLKVES